MKTPPLRHLLRLSNCIACAKPLSWTTHYRKYCTPCGVHLRTSLGRNYTRERVRLRDNYTCRGCGFRRTTTQVRRYNSRIVGLKGRIKSLDVHHLNGECGTRSRIVDRIENLDSLITLCHRCHYNRHDFGQRLRKRMAARTLPSLVGGSVTPYGARHLLELPAESSEHLPPTERP